MNTKLLAPSLLAAVLGFSSWSAGAASSYPEAAPPMTKTSPVNASDMESAKSTPNGPEGAKYVNNLSGRIAPNGIARPEPQDGAFRIRVEPAPMFNLREGAGG
jgi:hypothetical protein